jgi:hypothetical protein
MRGLGNNQPHVYLVILQIQDFDAFSMIGKKDNIFRWKSAPGLPALLLMAPLFRQRWAYHARRLAKNGWGMSLDPPLRVTLGANMDRFQLASMNTLRL